MKAQTTIYLTLVLATAAVIGCGTKQDDGGNQPTAAIAAVGGQPGTMPKYQMRIGHLSPMPKLQGVGGGAFIPSQYRHPQ